MKQGPRRGQPRVDADGVRIVYHQRAPLLRSVPLIAVAITGSIAAFLLTRTFDRPEHVPTPDQTAHASIDPPQASVPEKDDEPERVNHSAPRKQPRTAIRRRSRGTSTSGNRPRDETREDAGQKGGREVDAGDYIAALQEAGQTEGLAAFSPPGTRPPRTGVIVPDDYMLPEGFARHYQATDDGRRLPAILAVAPGYELVDYEGNLVPLTDGYIVPPDFAPPDLPVRMLEIPSENDRGQSDR